MRLTDCFMDLIAYTAYFVKSVARKQPPYELLKANILRSLNDSESCVKKGLFPPEEYDQARFAVCAWVDEVILSSPWNEKDKWKREQLQRMYYKTTDAGEEFFERLNALDFYQRNVREVYYLCLALGFMGRYCQHGDEYLLGQVKASNLKLLLGSSVGLPSLERSDFFPEAYQTGATVPVARQRRGMGFSLLNLVCLVGPVALLGILYLVCNWILNSKLEHIFSKIA